MVNTSIPADTPEQMKAAILKFLNFRAEQERAKQTICRSKTEKDACKQRADFLAEIAAEIDAAEIVPAQA